MSNTDGIGKVVILTGGVSDERDISLKTSVCIQKALARLNIEQEVILAEADFINKLYNAAPDIVFIAMHGADGENGTIQGLLESMDIMYTGSGVLASAVCMDKSVSKKLFRYHGMLTPNWQDVSEVNDIRLPLPFVIKPIDGGSTIATTIVREKDQIEPAFKKAYSATRKSLGKNKTKIMVEEYIPGRELTVGILNGVALPILEICSMTEFYDYKAKYSEGMSEHPQVEDIEDALYKKLQKNAEKAFEICGCSGMGRVDYRLDSNKFYLLEINTIPGMTDTSLLPEAAGHEGISFDDLVLKILKSVEKNTKKA
ncbi:D-alanine--D-alanine ligase [Elusimicrobiota bacterium]